VSSGSVHLRAWCVMVVMGGGAAKFNRPDDHFGVHEYPLHSMLETECAQGEEEP